MPAQVPYDEAAGDRVRAAGRVGPEIPHRVAGAPIVRTQTNAELKLEALERFVKDYTLAKSRAGHFAELARRITDLVAEDMADAEKDAAWLLIRYAKKQEHIAAQQEKAADAS